MLSSPKPVGRYAPSPTGDLHLGNLRTALLAWLYTRLQGGIFLMRMEDLDVPRIVPGSADKILRDLEWLGIDWDGDVLYQSDRLEQYERAVVALEQQNLIYPCYCSRKDIQQAASAPHGQTAVYSGTCRHLNATQRLQKRRVKSPSIRVRVDSTLSDECGDFVIKRADGLFSYQLAVAVDDLDQGVNEVVRGADLKSSVARQLYLARCLAPTSISIRYLHAPLLNDHSGQRMSKRDGSQSVDQWIDDGGSAESLVAHLSASLGLIDYQKALTAQELLSRLTLDVLESCLD